MIIQHRHGMTVAQIAELVGGRVEGSGEHEITGINRIEVSGASEVTFLSNAKYAKFLELTKAGCVIISEALWQGASAPHTNVIICGDAYRGFVQVMQKFFPPTVMEPGVISPAATIHPSATIDPSAAIGPGCAIGQNATIGKNAQLFANVVLYPNVTIGTDTVIHGNVTLCTSTTIGDRCIIHSGVVVGADGFGFFENPDGSFEKIPQVGTVQIGNDVEIGANTCIDRAAVGATIIEDGVKLDNLIHIAHGVKIGKDSAMAAQAGISGSTTIGKRNRIAGQVGIVGHISTTENVIVEAQSGLSKSVTAPGAYFGSPAKEHRTALKMEAALKRLPEMMREFQELKRIVSDLNDQDT